MKTQHVSRRRFIGTSMLAAAGMAFASKSTFANSIFAPAKPNSKINGVQIGVITYSFRSMPGSIEQVLQYCVDSNISAIELMGDTAEEYAGKPVNPVKMGPRTPGQPVQLTDEQKTQLAA